jgi:hypothetical protein
MTTNKGLVAGRRKARVINYEFMIITKSRGAGIAFIELILVVLVRIFLSLFH